MAIYGEFGDGGDYWRGELNGQGYARYVDGRVCTLANFQLR